MGLSGFSWSSVSTGPRFSTYSSERRHSRKGGANIDRPNRPNSRRSFWRPDRESPKCAWPPIKAVAMRAIFRAWHAQHRNLWHRRINRRYYCAGIRETPNAGLLHSCRPSPLARWKGERHGRRQRERRTEILSATRSGIVSRSGRGSVGWLMRGNDRNCDALFTKSAGWGACMPPRARQRLAKRQGPSAVSRQKSGSGQWAGDHHCHRSIQGCLALPRGRCRAVDGDQTNKALAKKTKAIGTAVSKRLSRKLASERDCPRRNRRSSMRVRG